LISSVGSGFFSIFSCFGKLSFLVFLAFFSRNIPHAATTKQQIQTIGLTTNQAIPMVTNHTIRVNPKAIIPVQTQMMFARNGSTFAKVSINLNIAANPQYINNSQNNLIIHVIILFSFCACKNISSALTLP
jgi:hypothetical protein